MTAQSKLLVFVTAFGTAIAAGAQSAEPSGAAVPVIPDPNPAIMPSGNATPTGTQPSGNAAAPATNAAAPATNAATPATQPSRNAGAPATQQDRVPANRQDDAVRACSDVPAADVEGCIARENARKQNVGTSASRTKDASKGSASSGGGKPMGSAGGDSANADTATKK
jgi:hypothetical protein